MNNKKMLFPLLFSSLFLSVGILSGTKLSPASATFIDTKEASETFDKRSLNSDIWQTNNAELNIDHYSLRFQPAVYQWTSQLLLQEYRLTESYVMDVDLSSTGDKDWFGVSLGVKEKGGLFSDANFGIIFYSVFNGSSNPNGICVSIADSGNLEQDFKIGHIYASPLMEYGVKTKLRIHVNIISYNYSEVYYDILTLDGEMIKEHDPVKDVYKVNRNLSGYVGFNDSGNPVEISHFLLKNAEDNSTIYEDNFTNSGIQYANDGSGVWAAMRFSEDDVKLGPVGDLRLLGKDSSITFNTKFSKPETPTVDTAYFATADVAFNTMSSNAVAGFEIAKASVNDAGEFYGIQKERFGYNLVHINNGQAVDSIKYPNNVPGNKVNLKIEVKSGNRVVLSTPHTSLSTNAFKIEGYLGIKNISLDGAACTGPSIDNFNINKITDRGDQTPDVSINFNGTQKKTAGFFEYEDFYVSKKEWKMTTTSDMFLSQFDGTIDPNNPDGKLYYSHSTNSTMFGSKNKYSDYVVKFKVQILSEVSSMEERAGFALEFGLDKFDTYYDNAQSIGLYNTNASNPSQSLIIMNHCHNKDTGSYSMDFPKSDGTFAQLFEKRNGEYPTFDVMYIVKDGMVSMHFKYEDEPMSVLATPRVIAKAEGTTDGYCTVVGTSNIDFSLDDYSVTNLDFVNSNLEYVPYKDAEYQITTRKDFAISKDTTGLELNGSSINGNSLRISNDGSASTTSKTGNGMYRMKFKGIENKATLKFGDLYIDLVDEGNSKSLVARNNVTSETINLGKNFVFANSTFEFLRVDGKLTVKFVSGDIPLSGILNEKHEITLRPTMDYEKFEISSKGITDLSSFIFVNFDSNQTIFNRNFNPDTDIVVAWTERPSIQDMNKKGCGGSITTTSIIVGLSSLFALGFIVLKRKETL